MKIPALEVPAVTPVVLLAGLIARQWGVIGVFPVGFGGLGSAPFINSS